MHLPQHKMLFISNKIGTDLFEMGTRLAALLRRRQQLQFRLVLQLSDALFFFL